MAGKITTNSVVLGDSVTDTQNFVLKTNADGTATLARGALGGLGTVFGVNGSGALTGATLVAPALGTPASGVLTNCTGVAASALPAGSVLQVLSATKTDTFSTTSTSYVDVTGLSISITPKFSTSKILITYSTNVGWDANRVTQLRLVRNSTAICVGDVSSSRTQASNTTGADIGFTYETRSQWVLSNNFLDSPATTSATTYKIQIGAIGDTDGTAIYVNRSSLDQDAPINGRTASTITVMEIAG